MYNMFILLSIGSDRWSADVSSCVLALSDHRQYVLRGVQGRSVRYVFGRLGRATIVQHPWPVDCGGCYEFWLWLWPAQQVRDIRQCGQSRAVDHIRDKDVWLSVTRWRLPKEVFETISHDSYLPVIVHLYFIVCNNINDVFYQKKKKYILYII